MANTQGMCTQFKIDVLSGRHNFSDVNPARSATTRDAYKMALYAATATRNNTDTVYNTTGELAASGNYTQGGNAVTNTVNPAASGTTSYWTPSASVQWTSFTSSAAFDCAVLYNDSHATKYEVAVFTFSSQSITAGTFSLIMPTNDASTGLVRIGGS